MFDPIRAKARVIITTGFGFLGGLALASGLGWTGPSYAMPPIQNAPQLSEDAVRPALNLSEAFANVAEAVTPAVVRIEVTATQMVSARDMQVPEGFRQFFDIPEEGEPRERQTQGGGSGFIISQDGYILTNNHVVEGADEIRVYLTDGRYFMAETVGNDPTTDVAVVKIEETGLPFLSLGKSESLRVGEWVLAIGNPGFGGGAARADDLDYTVTAGIVSALGRPLRLIQSELQQNPEFAENAAFAIENYIQTDAVINRGNSGGPMVNIMGQAVGINSAIFSPSGTYVGYGFAIPIDLAGRVMEDLISYGRVRRAWLGVSIEEVAPEDQEAYNLPEVAGVLVQEATAGGPAEDAGLRQGDVIYSVNDRVVRSPNGLQNLVAQMRRGDDVTVRIYRNRSPMDIRIRLGEAPLSAAPPETPEPEAPAEQEKLGIGVQELTDEVAGNFGFESGGGVIISEITPLGPAARRLVPRGVKILELNGTAIRTPGDVNAVLQGVSAGDVVSMRLEYPDGTTRIVNVRAAG
jgi:serine protease Do